MSSELIEQLKNKIGSIDTTPVRKEVGTVISSADGVVSITGLSDCMSGEMLDFGGGVMGAALNLEEDTVGAIVLGDAEAVVEGAEVSRTGKILSVPVSDQIIGRVVDGLGNPVDGGPGIEKDKDMYLERKAPQVMDREPVGRSMHTGITSIDALTPIGRGQRQLLIGDRQTGKTTVAIDTILNQKGRNVKCIYVAIGQKYSRITRLVELLKEKGAMDYTTIVAASASENPALLYLAPYTGVSIGEYFMDKGEDVLVIYDDLSKHAAAYREISLLLRRPPGREAYPGDVFYLHSRLLERAAQMHSEKGGGSLTALPVIETQAGDVSAYIPTNVISITDGQVVLDSQLFNKGQRPAINVGLSVSRVGGAAQLKSTKKNSGALKLQLAQFRELESFSQFDTDLDEETKSKLERGKRAMELLKQPPSSPYRPAIQVVFLYGLKSGILDKINVEDVGLWKKEISNYFEASHSSLLDTLEEKWDEEVEGALKKALEDVTR